MRIQYEKLGLVVNECIWDCCSHINVPAGGDKHLMKSLIKFIWTVAIASVHQGVGQGEMLPPSHFSAPSYLCDT